MSRLWWQSVCSWWGRHEGWAAALTMGVGVFAFGYSAATIICQHAAVKEVRQVSEAYQSALASKDQVILVLGRQTVVAAKTANSAAKSADSAAHLVKDAANKAADASHEQQHKR